MTNQTMFCPFKYDATIDFDQWYCEGDGCAMWDSRMRTCGFFSAIVMSKAIASNLREIHKIIIAMDDERDEGDDL